MFFFVNWKKNGFISVRQLDLEIEFSYFETQFGQYFLVNSKLDTDRATNFWPNSDPRRHIQLELLARNEAS